MINKPVLALITSSILMMLTALPAMAADSSVGATANTTPAKPVARPSTSLASTYSSLAGSDANAKSLVEGLRSGTSITLKSGASSSSTTSSGSTTFTPATSKLGYGNVNIALALAQAELSKLGITNPTPTQLQAALNGGVITTSKGATTVPGVLQLRSEGKGWGVIAKSLDLKLGQVVSASKTERNVSGAGRKTDVDVNSAIAKVEKVAPSTRVDKVERIAKVDRPEKIERPERIDRPEKVERPERVERPKR